MKSLFSKFSHMGSGQFCHPLNNVQVSQPAKKTTTHYSPNFWVTLAHERQCTTSNEQCSHLVPFLAQHPFLALVKAVQGNCHHAKAGSTSSWSPRVQLVTMEGTEGESTHLRHSFQSRAKLFGGCGRQRPDLVLALDLLRHDQPPRPLAQKAEVRLRLLREPFRQALCRLQLCRLIMQHAHVYSQTDSGDA